MATNPIHSINAELRDSWQPVPYRILRRISESGESLSFELEPSTSAKIVAILPGQFNMLYLHGYGEIPISVSRIDADQIKITHTIRNVGKVSAALCRLKKDDIIAVRGPFGTGWPLQTKGLKKVIIAAGGIGLAPLRPIIDFFIGQISHGIDLELLYGARSPGEMIFAKDRKKWQTLSARHELFNYAETVDRAERDWTGNVGNIMPLLPRTADTESTAAFLCGPEVMMRLGAARLTEIGTKPEKIFVSNERSMKCGIGLCGHCQWRENFLCKQGPVLSYAKAKELFAVREL